MRNSSPTFETREGFFDISTGFNTDSNSPTSIHIEDGSDVNSNDNSDSLDTIHRIEKDAADYFPVQIDPTANMKRTCYDDPIKSMQAKTMSERILETINGRAPPRIIRRILKCSFAYFLSTLFSTIYPVAIWLGTVPFITSTGCLLCHPGRTMGAQFDATLTAALGAALAIIYGLAGVAAATTYNVNHPDSYAGAGINCMFLVVGVFGAQLLRQVFPKLSVFSLQFMIVQLFTLTISVGSKEIPKDLSSQFGLCLLIGNFISLFINLFIWPETAVDGLGRALSQTLSDSKEMLDTIARQFFLDPKSESIPGKVVDDLSIKMRLGVSKVNTAYHEAKYEISYAYSSSADLNQTRHSLYRITKHLSILGGSLKKRQTLFKNADFFAPHEVSDETRTESNNRTPDPMGAPGETYEHLSSQEGSPNPNVIHNRRNNLRHSALEATKRYMESGDYSIPNSKDPEEETTSNTLKHSASTSALDQISNKAETTNIRFELPSITSTASEQRRLSSSSMSEGNERSKNNANSANPSKRRSHLLSLWSSLIDSSNDVNRTSSDTTDQHSESEYDYSESNQHSTSSFKSFLKLTGLSATKPKVPERAEKKIGSKEKRLLEMYLENLRDPLLSLVVECASVLDCVRDSLADQLDLSSENDAGISRNGYWRYILHVLKIKKISDKDHLKHPKRGEKGSSFVCNCAEKMRLQIIEFDKCERNRLKALYKLNISHMKNSSLTSEIREALFLVFFFIFSMREVALELEEMAQNMRTLQLKTQAEILSNPNQTKKKKKIYMPQITIQTWRKWVHSNSHQNVKDRGGYTFSYLYSDMPTEHNQKSAEDEYELAQYRMKGNATTSDAINTIAREESNSSNESNYAALRKRETMTRDLNEKNDQLSEMEPSLPTYNKPIEKKVPPLLRFRYQLWLIVRYIQGYEFKFALKMCFAVGVLTMPVYIPGYYEWYNAIRGQWAALTVIMVMSPTSGGTLSSGLWRLVGTLVGAFTAWAILEIDGNSAYLLSGFSFFFALPNFYIHFSTSYSKVAIIVLTTYIVIALGQYWNVNYYETVSEKVWLRTSTLIIGLVTALILNWMVWPFIARDAVRKNLGTTIGDLGDYYSYIMGTFLYHDEQISPTEVDYKKAIKIEKKLEKMFNTCNELLQLTDHEPRLKGPFPKEFYKSILASAHNLLDCMISLRVSLMKMTPEVKKTVRNLDKYLHRRDMVASILLHFYTLSSSLKAKIPLPSYMPSARNARAKLLRYRHEEDRPEKLLRYRNLTWSAMACTTEEIIDELEHLTDLIRFIVGESKFSYMARRMENPE